MKTVKIKSEDYKKLRMAFKIVVKDKLTDKKRWVPISVAAKEVKKSNQTIRLLLLSKQIKAIKIGKSPILVDLEEVTPSHKALQLAEETGKDPRVVELILQESSSILRSRLGLIVAEHKLGFICANAGIDRSNISGEEGDPREYVLLLPEDPDRSAERLRSELEKRSGVQIGILLIDSHGRAWRNGIVGASIGFSGVPGIVDMRGKEDLFGYKLRVTQIAAADELAAGASLVMGQADEAIPIVHVRGFPYDLREGSFSELPRDPKNDLFR